MAQVLQALLDRNREWSEKIRSERPNYFDGLALQQKPEYLWIGCSDSRVPANVIAGLEPGEVFVHRNVANVVHSSDMNLLSVLEFAVDTLKVRQIIVCGHYGCGGVRAATEEDLPHGLADHWLEPIRRVAKRHARELSGIDDVEMRRDRLAELNVLESVARVAETPILRRAWKNSDYPLLHGLIYGIRDGVLRNLDCTTSGADSR
ncbi:carbonic anhydrase [Ostreiculturibacter nitratireducens]|uniref:carbonic anhydrase n=1 Tax=Ostreiculturibacter nitratireducens TaxID=3075226 RepID=UPI0031B5AB8E